MAEVLEERRLYAVTAVITSRVLVVTGTTGDDVIKIYQKSSTSQVTVFEGDANNIVTGSPFSVNNFDSILVNADSGNDTVTIGSTPHGTGSDILTSFDVPVSKAAEMHGDAGNDTLYGTDQVDSINGEAGTDSLFGAPGNDVLSGGDDADTIDGETGTDTENGNNGNDVFSQGTDDNGADVMNGGAGTDKADYSGRSAALKISNDALADDGEVDIDPGTAGNQSEGDKVQTDVEWLVGGNGNDTINGGGGNDTLEGGPGNDVMYGSTGDDVLWGGGGSDVMYGDAGNDTFHSGDGVADTVYGGSGSSDVSADRDGSDSIQEVEIFL